MLERTDLRSIASPTARFGLGAVLRQNFARVLGLTPTRHRARFSCADDEVPAAWRFRGRLFGGDLAFDRCIRCSGSCGARVLLRSACAVALRQAQGPSI